MEAMVKIEDNITISTGKINPGSVAPTRRTLSPKNRIGDQAEKVSISETARDVASAAAKIKTMPDVDVEKVTRVRNALKNGTYKVDVEKAANGLLAESLLLDRNIT